MKFEWQHYRHDNENQGIIIAYAIQLCRAALGKSPRITVSTPQSINYRNHHFGNNGNDNCGQMSCFVFFGVMGFYPVLQNRNICHWGRRNFQIYR